MLSKELEQFHEIEDYFVVDEKLACVGLKLPSVVNTEGVSMHIENEEMRQKLPIM